MPETSNSELCPDWVFVNTSNVNIAKDRGWFKTYTPFASTINLSHGSNSVRVLGIGSVEIPTKRSPNLSGVSSHGSLRLREVLHVPDSICNVLGYPVMSSDGYNIENSFTPKSKGTITNINGRKMAYFDPKKKLFTLKVRGHPTGPLLGPSAFKEGTVYMIGYQWGAVEQQRWQEFKDKNDLAEPISESVSVSVTSPYTTDEKEYLKQSWRNEYHFLLLYGLDIRKEEDRAEGRSILRAFRSKDVSDEMYEDDEFSLEGHQADYNFSSGQLKWMNKCYGNSENFMVSYGLKFFNDDDLKEARAIADAITAQDEEG